MLIKAPRQGGENCSRRPSHLSVPTPIHLFLVLPRVPLFWRLGRYRKSFSLMMRSNILDLRGVPILGFEIPDLVYAAAPQMRDPVSSIRKVV